MTITRFEELPAELISQIFVYFTTDELYKTFANLNDRLDCFIKSSCDLSLCITSHCDSFRAVFVYFTELKLSGVRSFHVFRLTNSDEYIESIEQFIHPNLSPRLESLQVPFCSQSILNWIFDGKFPRLKICHIYDSSNRKINLLLSNNIQLPALRQLTIEGQDGNEFEKILFKCPNLSYFDFSCYACFSFKQLTHPYVSLKRLRLSYLTKFLFHNGQFMSLVSCFPNLTHFYLNVEQCPEHNETIDFAEIAQDLKRSLPHLIFLDWHIDLILRNRSSYYWFTFKQVSQFHPLFYCFGRTDQHLHIASFDFTAIYRYDRQFVRLN